MIFSNFCGDKCNVLSLNARLLSPKNIKKTLILIEKTLPINLGERFGSSALEPL